MFKIAVLVGSLRRGSINLSLARAIERLGEGRFAFDYVDLSEVPMYNEDLWAEPPAAVLALKAKVEAADALLFVTPEFNRSVPPVLKNAIDWGSRPWGSNSWSGKPAAIGGASLGVIGSAVAQSHLRNTLLVLDVILMGQPEIYLSFRQAAIDESGTVGDDAARDLLGRFLTSFESWITRVR